MSRRGVILLAGLALSATAGEADALGLSAGASYGAMQLDPDFERHQLDTQFRQSLGAEVHFTAGPWALGWRGTRASTHQEVSLPGLPPRIEATFTTQELHLRVRMVRVLGTQLLVHGGGGQLRVDYSPSHLVVPTSPPIVIEFAPTTEWIVSTGLGLSRSLGGPLSLGLSVDRGFFPLGVSHRRGSETIETREFFANWSARVALEVGVGL